MVIHIVSGCVPEVGRSGFVGYIPGSLVVVAGNTGVRTG